jgi:hypothetical protein
MMKTKELNASSSEHVDESIFESLAQELQKKQGSFSVDEVLSLVFERYPKTESKRKIQFDALKSWISNLQVSTYTDDRNVKRYTLI